MPSEAPEAARRDRAQAAADPTGAARPLYREPGLQTVFALSLVAVMGVSSVAPVFPEVARDLGVDAARVGWLVTSFSLPAVFLSPLLGLLADVAGQRRVLVPGLVLFAAAGTACAFTRDFQQLLVLRGLQGVGAAPIQALSIALIGDLYSGAERATAVGLNGMVVSMGAIVYPILGGAIATAGIYYPFALAALALPVAVLVLRRTGLAADRPAGPRGRVREQMRDQIRGVLRCASSPGALGLFAAGLLTMALFFGVHVTYLPVLLGTRFSTSPAAIGVIMSVTHVMFALVASQFGKIGSRAATLPVIAAAFAGYGVAIVLLGVMPSAWLLVVPAAVFGLVHGINIPAQQMGLISLAPSRFRAGFLSLNTTVIRTGQTVGPLLVGLFYLAGGFGSAFGASALLAFTAAAVTLGLHLRAKGARA